MRYAVRLDRDWDSEDSEQTGSALARLLTAPLDTDPQIRQQAMDEQEDLDEAVMRSYSEAAAYVLLLIRVDWHLEDLADLLLIGCGTLKLRMRASGLLARIQPSLFDGVARIDRDFDPWRKRRALRRGFGQVPAAQGVLWC